MVLVQPHGHGDPHLAGAHLGEGGEGEGENRKNGRFICLPLRLATRQESEGGGGRESKTLPDRALQPQRWDGEGSGIFIDPV